MNYFSGLPQELIIEIFIYLDKFDDVLNLFDLDEFKKIFENFNFLLIYKLSIYKYELFKDIRVEELLDSTNVKFKNTEKYDIYYNISNYIKISHVCEDLNALILHYTYLLVSNKNNESISIPFRYKRQHLTNLSLILNIKSLKINDMYDISKVFQDDSIDIEITLYITYKIEYFLRIDIGDVKILYIPLNIKEFILIMFHIYYGYHR